MASYQYFDEKTGLYTEQLLLSAAASAVTLDTFLCGGQLHSVEIFTSADDAVTFAINSELGTELYSRTTSAATAGEIEYVTTPYPLRTGSAPTYTLSGLGSGTATVEVTVKK